VGVLVEEVVFYLPRVVEPKAVCENDLLEGFLKEAVLVAFFPRLREL
jgi:hypothetical protein